MRVETIRQNYGVFSTQILKQNNIKVNHIITDPPYNISQDNNFNTMKNPRKGVDFGEWDKNFDLYNWISDYEEILEAANVDKNKRVAEDKLLDLFISTYLFFLASPYP